MTLISVRSHAWAVEASSLPMPRPFPFSMLSLEALAAAVATDVEPNLIVDSNSNLTISPSIHSAQIELTGSCMEGSRVALSGAGLKDSHIIDCNSRHYSARVSPEEKRGNEAAIVTQLRLDGSIIAARTDLNPNIERAHQSAQVEDLVRGLPHQQSDTSIRLKPGRYSDLRIRIPKERVSSGAHLLIDGGEKVILSGRTKIEIERDAVTLSGIIFEDTRAGTVTVRGNDVRLTSNKFFGCGTFEKPLLECILVSPTAKRSEIDFNTFSGSLSMSIKVRANRASEKDQPVDAYIHHNIFRDIERNSPNGQEPIQIAGPNGGGSGAALNTRVEHNLFLRAEGDAEAISLKTPGSRVLGNVFYDMRAAPNLRGSFGSLISGNIFFRSGSLRIAGRHHSVRANLFLCSRGNAVGLTHGSASYQVAEGNSISDNVFIVSKTAILFHGQEESITELARENEVIRNSVVTRSGGSVVSDRSGQTAPSELNDVTDNSIIQGYSKFCTN